MRRWPPSLPCAARSAPIVSCCWTRTGRSRRAADEPLDLRVSAFSPASIALLEETGAWQRLDRSRLADYERMVIWPEHVPADSPDALVFEAAELGEARLGVIAENRAVQAALLARCEALGIRLLREKLVGLEFGGDVAVLTAGAERLEAALVVGADGANSAVRAAAAIPAKERSYGQQAIVATVRATRPRVATAFQCFLSTGPLALLPLPDGCYSIVWSATEERARELLALDEAGFNAALTAASDGVAGSLALASPRAAFRAAAAGGAALRSTRLRAGWRCGARDPSAGRPGREPGPARRRGAGRGAGRSDRPARASRRCARCAAMSASGAAAMR